MDDLLNDLIDKCGYLYNAHKKKGDSLIAEKNWTLGDPRAGLIYVTGNTIVDHLIHLNLIRSTLLKKEWWSANMKVSSSEAIQKGADAYTVSTKAGLFFVFFGRVEAYLRKLDSSLNSKDNSKEKFNVVYRRFLNLLGLVDDVIFFDFLSKIRNLIHTDGTYNKEDVQFSFNGKDYFFKKGSKVDFLTLNFIMDLYTEASGVIFRILQTKEIGSLKF